jgi:hypothetical protein
MGSSTGKRIKDGRRLCVTEGCNAFVPKYRHKCDLHLTSTQWIKITQDRAVYKKSNFAFEGRNDSRIDI